MYIPLPPPPFAARMLIVGRWVVDQTGQPQVDLGQITAPDISAIFEYSKNDVTRSHTLRLIVSTTLGQGWVPLFIADAHNIEGIGWQWLHFLPQ